jgi:hypothetical protein
MSQRSAELDTDGSIPILVQLGPEAADPQSRHEMLKIWHTCVVAVLACTPRVVAVAAQEAPKNWAFRYQYAPDDIRLPLE